MWSHGGWYVAGGSGAYAGVRGRGWFADWNFIFTDCIVWNFRGAVTP